MNLTDRRGYRTPMFYTPDDARSTYRSLRIALVALVVFLAASVVDTRLSADCWQGSISAYFYTTSHAVFVASLCAVGVCLIVYKGSTRTEDVLLNFAGVLAFAVALAPIASPVPCRPGLPIPAELTAGVDNNVRALLIAIVVGVAFYRIVRSAHPDPPNEYGVDPPIDTRRFGGAVKWVLARAATLMSWVERGLPYFLGLGLVAYFAAFATDWTWFTAWRHEIAAIAMFVAIILVVLHYAAYAAARRRAGNKRGRYVGLYLGIAAAMIVALLWAAVLEFWKRPLGVLVVEAACILLFGLFWVVQSFDLWRLEKYPVGSLSDLLRALTDGQPPEADAQPGGHHS
jgi:hypothetical protein